VRSAGASTGWHDRRVTTIASFHSGYGLRPADYDQQASEPAWQRSLAFLKYRS